MLEDEERMASFVLWIGRLSARARFIVHAFKQARAQ
jgi:hypothetical protein